MAESRARDADRQAAFLGEVASASGPNGALMPRRERPGVVYSVIVLVLVRTGQAGMYFRRASVRRGGGAATRRRATGEESP
ncbi:hypothetical protein GCM10023204_09610 [Actinomycetospora succinea]